MVQGVEDRKMARRPGKYMRDVVSGFLAFWLHNREATATVRNERNSEELCGCEAVRL